MTGDDFLSLAGKLLAGAANPSEAICRTVISRAYYGAFHLGRAYLTELGIKCGKEHGDVWTCLGSSGVIAAKRVATSLAVLHENRRVADYELNSPKPADVEFVRDNVERAAEIQTQLRNCLQEPLKSQIKAGIQARQRK